MVVAETVEHQRARMPSGREHDELMELVPRRIRRGRLPGPLERARVSLAPPKDVHTSELAEGLESCPSRHDDKTGAKPQLYALRTEVDAQSTTGCRNQRMIARMLTIPSRGRSI